MASASLQIRETPIAATDERGAYAARPALLVLFQLLLLILVVREFEIEKSRRLAELMSIVACGLIPYMLLPLRLRLPWFLLLSAIVCAAVAGWANTLWIWGIGAALIGICHLPLPYWLRGALLVGSGVGLAYFRVADQMPFWPIVGSMFMFRLFVYFRELRDERAPASVWMRLSYFFMLPNACFPFYPIVDYRTFCESWLKQPAAEVAQEGINWIARGLVQLLVYRAIKYFVLPSPEDVRSIGDVALFLAANYMLYLRISGAFHLITGILHLFGFSLPRTHDNYFLASSFMDIWRRINIYWKDFLERHFFKPAFFRLRKFGARNALVGSIAFVFVVTWAFHSYQVFWLVGEFPISTNEIVLWLTAGVVVSINAYLEYSRRKKRSASGSPMLQSMRHSLQVVGVFLTVSLFWACWTLPGFLPQLAKLAVATPGFWQDGWKVIAAITLAVGIGVAAQLLRRYGESLPNANWSPAFGNVAAAVLLLFVTAPTVSGSLDLNSREKLDNMQRELLTPAEASRDAQGYYEQLADVRSQSLPLVSGELPQSSHNAVVFTELTRPRADLMEAELIPGWNGTLAGGSISINNHGMRNPPVSKRKPAGVYRIAVVGSSVAMGYGVSDDQPFARLLETKINAALPASGSHVEVLNFGVGQYDSLHIAAALRTKIFAFEPDAVLYVAHQGEFHGPPRHVAKRHELGERLEFAALNDAIAGAGVTDKTSPGMTATLLQSQADKISTAIYRDIAADCRQRGVRPVWCFLPIPGILEQTDSADAVVGAAQDAGLEIVDLRDWADGADPAEIKLGPTDHHLNAAGHALAAEAIWQALRQHPSALPPLTAQENH
ncbi:hypothetical protein [Blastopirellula marina]|uniref:SGNH hydrolase-type esterase domain-containing protein n=1 Tax=Blastopirellula marina TaxID=124 RepID=A0A2S8GNA5_9BACT|nr:hypothetical protein [Blastopirellula marina]PQO45899.1 hypothetical protein C5Y93_11635 [Blastopirellula marina]